MTGLAAAWRFLTRIPLPRLARGDWDDFSRALPWFPAVGLMLGGLLAVVDTLLGAWLGPLTTAALVVGVWLMVTGALHLDGLADTCDAVFAAVTPERRLEIMRDTQVGVFGAVALVVVVLLKVAALAELPDGLRVWALVAAPALGRWALVLSATLFPYARPEGLGSPLRASATPRGLTGPGVAVVLVALAGGAWLVGVSLVATLGAWLIGRWVVGKLRAGLTGDCYGAVCELVETLALVASMPLFHVLGPGWRWW